MEDASDNSERSIPESVQARPIDWPRGPRRAHTLVAVAAIVSEQPYESEISL